MGQSYQLLIVLLALADIAFAKDAAFATVLHLGRYFLPDN